MVTWPKKVIFWPGMTVYTGCFVIALFLIFFFLFYGRVFIKQNYALHYKIRAVYKLPLYLTWRLYHGIKRIVLTIFLKLKIIWLLRKLWRFFKWLFPRVAFFISGRLPEIIMVEAPEFFQQLFVGLIMSGHYKFIGYFSHPEDPYEFLLRRFGWSLRAIFLAHLYSIKGILLIIILIPAFSFLFLCLFVIVYTCSVLKLKLFLQLFKFKFTFNNFFFPKSSVIFTPLSALFFNNSQFLSKEGFGISNRQYSQPIEYKNFKTHAQLKFKKFEYSSNISYKDTPPISFIGSDNVNFPERSFLRMIWVNDLVSNKEIVNRLNYCLIFRNTGSLTVEPVTGERGLWKFGIPYQTIVNKTTLPVTNQFKVSVRATGACWWSDLDYEQYITQLVFNRAFNKLRFSQLNGVGVSNQHIESGLGTRSATYNLYTLNLKCESNINPLTDPFNALDKYLLFADKVQATKGRVVSLGKSTDIVLILKGLKTLYANLPDMFMGVVSKNVFDTYNYVNALDLSILNRLLFFDAEKLYTLKTTLTPFFFLEYTHMHHMKFETRPDRFYTLPISLDFIIRPFFDRALSLVTYFTKLEFLSRSKYNLDCFNFRYGFDDDQIDNSLAGVENVLYQFFYVFKDEVLLSKFSTSEFLSVSASRKSFFLNEIFNRLDDCGILIDNFLSNVSSSFNNNNQFFSEKFHAIFIFLNSLKNKDSTLTIFIAVLKFFFSDTFFCKIKKLGNSSLTFVLLYREIIKFLKESFIYLRPSAFLEYSRTCTTSINSSLLSHSSLCGSKRFRSSLQLLHKFNYLYNFTAVYNRSLTTFKFVNPAIVSNNNYNDISTFSEINKNNNKLVIGLIWTWLFLDIPGFEKVRCPHPFAGCIVAPLNTSVMFSFSSLAYDPSGSLGSLKVKPSEYFVNSHEITHFHVNEAKNYYIRIFAGRDTRVGDNTKHEDFFRVMARARVNQLRARGRSAALHFLAPLVMFFRRFQAVTRYLDYRPLGSFGLINRKTYKNYSKPYWRYWRGSSLMEELPWNPCTGQDTWALFVRVLSVCKRREHFLKKFGFLNKQQSIELLSLFKALIAQAKKKSLNSNYGFLINLLDQRNKLSLLGRYKELSLFRPISLKKTFTFSDYSFEESFFSLLGQRSFVVRNPIIIKPLTKAPWKEDDDEPDLLVEEERVWSSETVASLIYFNYFYLGFGRYLFCSEPFYVDSYEYSLVLKERQRQKLRAKIDHLWERRRVAAKVDTADEKREKWLKQNSLFYTKAFYYNKEVIWQKKKKVDYRMASTKRGIKLTFAAEILKRKFSSNKNKVPRWLFRWFKENEKRIFRKYGVVKVYKCKPKAVPLLLWETGRVGSARQDKLYGNFKIDNDLVVGKAKRVLSFRFNFYLKRALTLYFKTKRIKVEMEGDSEDTCYVKGIYYVDIRPAWKRKLRKRRYFDIVNRMYYRKGFCLETDVCESYLEAGLCVLRGADDFETAGIGSYGGLRGAPLSFVKDDPLYGIIENHNTRYHWRNNHQLFLKFRDFIDSIRLVYYPEVIEELSRGEFIEDYKVPETMENVLRVLREEGQTEYLTAVYKFKEKEKQEKIQLQQRIKAREAQRKAREEKKAERFRRITTLSRPVRDRYFLKHGGKYEERVFTTYYKRIPPKLILRFGGISREAQKFVPVLKQKDFLRRVRAGFSTIKGKRAWKYVKKFHNQMYLRTIQPLLVHTENTVVPSKNPNYVLKFTEYVNRFFVERRRHSRSIMQLPGLFSDLHFSVFWEHRSKLESTVFFNKFLNKLNYIWTKRRNVAEDGYAQPTLRKTPCRNYYAYADRSFSLTSSFLYGLHRPIMETYFLNNLLKSYVFNAFYSIREVPWWIQRFEFKKRFMGFRMLSSAYGQQQSSAKFEPWRRTWRGIYVNELALVQDRRRKNNRLANAVNKGLVRYRRHFRLHMPDFPQENTWSVARLPFTYAWTSGNIYDCLDEKAKERRMQNLVNKYHLFTLYPSSVYIELSGIKNMSYISRYVSRQTKRKSFFFIFDFDEDSVNNRTIKRSQVSYLLSKISTTFNYGINYSFVRRTTDKKPQTIRETGIKDGAEYNKTYADIDNPRARARRHLFNISFLWFFASKSWSQAQSGDSKSYKGFAKYLNLFVLAGFRFLHGRWFTRASYSFTISIIDMFDYLGRWRHITHVGLMFFICYYISFLFVITFVYGF